MGRDVGAGATRISHLRVHIPREREGERRSWKVGDLGRCRTCVCIYRRRSSDSLAASSAPIAACSLTPAQEWEYLSAALIAARWSIGRASGGKGGAERVVAGGSNAEGEP